MEPQPYPAQVGRSGLRLLSRLGADYGLGASRPGQSAVCQGARKWGRPCHFSPPQIQAVSEILENGEEAPGPGPSLDRMLSSSSSVSSLNSTVRERKVRRLWAASPPRILTRSPCLTPPSPLNLTPQPPAKLPRSALYLVSSLWPPCSQFEPSALSSPDVSLHPPLLPSLRPRHARS